MDLLLRDNGGAVIIRDSFFLICGAQIMETGCFSLSHESLGHQYCLITWQGGFDSGSGPVYFGMGRISLWAKLLGWVYAPTPIIRWRSGLASVVSRLALWACALGPGPMHILFSILSVSKNASSSNFFSNPSSISSLSLSSIPHNLVGVFISFPS